MLSRALSASGFWSCCPARYCRGGIIRGKRKLFRYCPDQSMLPLPNGREFFIQGTCFPPPGAFGTDFLPPRGRSLRSCHLAELTTIRITRTRPLITARRPIEKLRSSAGGATSGRAEFLDR